MTPALDDILRKQDLSREEIKFLLSAEGPGMKRLLRRGLDVKLTHLDNYVHLRGLIELGNVCEKNCLYCGLRSGNRRVRRYCLTDEEVISCARQALDLGYGSVALQGGERSDPEFVGRIERLVRKIKEIDGGSLGVTLSLGEQTEETYRRWFEAGAHRYLLRIESSDEDLYYRIQVVPLTIPAVRNRREDIIPLCDVVLLCETPGFPQEGRVPGNSETDRLSDRDRGHGRAPIPDPRPPGR